MKCRFALATLIVILPSLFGLSGADATRAPRNQRKSTSSVTTTTTIAPTTTTIAPTTTTIAPTTTTIAPSTTTLPAPRDLPGNRFTDYLQLPGDQVVVVPNGTYTGGTVTAPHAATTGRYGGWLVLVAQDPRRAVVDLSAADLTLAAGTSRIMFVGFRFQNGSISDHGSDLRYWYTEHLYPIETWAASPLLHWSPTGYLPVDAKNISFYGADFHDLGDDAIRTRKTSNLLLQGVKIWNVNEKSFDLSDTFHNDAIQSTGALANVNVRDSFITGRLHIGTERNGDVLGFNMSNVWLTGSPSAGVMYAAKKAADGTALRVSGVRQNVRSWAHNNGNDRIDAIDGVLFTGAKLNTHPSRVDVADQSLSTAAPGSGMFDPATVWRAANPYATWASVLK